MVTLRGLAAADWSKEAVPGWTVRDLAAHVLGDFYGRLARDRDGHRDGPGFAPGDILETFIHRINQEWVDAHRRVSPAALVDAVGQGTDADPRFLSVVLDTFMRALPHTLREVDAPIGTRARVAIDGPAGGVWTATATGAAEGGWSLAEPDGGRPAAIVRLDAETAWRLCTRGIDPDTALTHVRIDGDRHLAEAVCRIVSIVH